jgi:23S rRNA pseudouridine1911/1915/1917 synthase
MSSQHFIVAHGQSGMTLAAFLRGQRPELSWSQARRLVEARRVRIGGELCLDPARRLREGADIELLAAAAAKPQSHEAVAIRYLDPYLVVVEKPAGISTVRHPLERDWPQRRKALSPTLEEIVPALIARREGRTAKGTLPRLRVVQRLDKETSGLVVFARRVEAERGLGRQFHAHSVTRRYLAVVPGRVSGQTITSRLVRDRGDGRRGTTSLPAIGKEAITHVEVVERLPSYTLVSCRLETGRTHQIRIHLAELGHSIAGEKVYNQRPGGPAEPDSSGAPRLALHAAELGFVHPISGKPLHWTMPLPADLQDFVDRLRGRSAASEND